MFTREAGELERTDRGRGDGGHGVAGAGLILAASYVALAVSLILVGLVLVHLLAPVRHWDDHVNAWFAARRGAPWTRISKDGTVLANTLGVAAVAVAATVIALACRCGRSAALLLSGLAVELAVFVTVNYTVQRPRPAVPHVGSTPSTYSFPSGHVAATLVLYGGIAVLITMRTRATWARALAWAAAAVMVAWVAFSRVYEGEHHPTDVMAGAFLGLGALAAATFAVTPWRPRPARDRTAARGTVVARRGIHAPAPFTAPEEAAG